MHIPDGFLDTKMSAGLFAAAASVLAYSMAKVKQALTAKVPAAVLAGIGNKTISNTRTTISKVGEQRIYLMAALASLIFSAQMFNFPIGGGTSGHLLGGMLAGAILGPFAGTLVIASVVAIQALFFADGGIIALGANIINMAFFGTFVVFYLYQFLKNLTKKLWLALAIGAWVSVMLAALATAIEISFSKTVPLETIVPAMLKVHTIIGITEALITILLFEILNKLTINHDTINN